MFYNLLSSICNYSLVLKKVSDVNAVFTMQHTITASRSVTVQYLSQLPAVNANYVNLMVITYCCRLKIKFDLLVTYYRIHKRSLLLLRIFAF